MFSHKTRKLFEIILKIIKPKQKNLTKATIFKHFEGFFCIKYNKKNFFAEKNFIVFKRKF